MKKLTFALFFGNRGFFPGEVIAESRKILSESCGKNGYGYLIMDESLTRYGAVETIEEGKLYSKFLQENKGKYDGIILSLPNFGDENGASVAFKDACLFSFRHSPTSLIKWILHTDEMRCAARWQCATCYVRWT